ncbi:hypothetical protein BYT27DRAFT_7213976 [Phlegmacium glaucopus]|nr:hypothetical protein BYT27DRAFT_7213976 [Phlegmacium glaucopus]
MYFPTQEAVKTLKVCERGSGGWGKIKRMKKVLEFRILWYEGKGKKGKGEGQDFHTLIKPLPMTKGQGFCKGCSRVKGRAMWGSRQSTSIWGLAEAILMSYRATCTPPVEAQKKKPLIIVVQWWKKTASSLNLQKETAQSLNLQKEVAISDWCRRMLVTIDDWCIMEVLPAGAWGQKTWMLSWRGGSVKKYT